MHASLRVSARALQLLAAGHHLGLPWGAAGAMDVLMYVELPCAGRHTTRVT